MDEFERLLKKYERVDKDGRFEREEDEEEITFTALGEQEEFVKIPKERIAVLIGKKGQTKKEIERKTKTKIEVDSETGEVFITATEETDDPLAVWKARDVVMAIGRGFSPERAFRLFNEGETLEVVNLTDIVVGNEKNALPRVRGRIIGRKGRTREIIEEMSGADISVYGKTVAIIGNPIQVEVAKTAVEKLARGSPHGVVYRYLERRKKDLELEATTYYEALEGKLPEDLDEFEEEEE
ncbi:RNA-binding protein, containing KH domain [Thermococcus kodakarensis KOD1]|uniref:RNA-binding protein, containing KH domain n=1 Tax=Thermococcus kodakarensis (strain ATCC BAA-918 / JCM 12380 / KOD1) TaxID=69014 RepID=Q5JH80_THEKO|nr:KH domain-containing protein [Thermococcus kodakarensis]WCN28813.1 KH domain-containing protein [Thermococcus kodakarensis]WCN31113.1 KH domain-containing protein [Thermococcus kodakarensis]BAD84989.1 RNA-binding protein, containing KH domain [Thermococcus kodakarensis KOD1]